MENNTGNNYCHFSLTWSILSVAGLSYCLLRLMYRNLMAGRVNRANLYRRRDMSKIIPSIIVTTVLGDLGSGDLSMGVQPVPSRAQVKNA